MARKYLCIPHLVKLKVLECGERAAEPEDKDFDSLLENVKALGESPPAVAIKLLWRNFREFALGDQRIAFWECAETMAYWECRTRPG